MVKQKGILEQAAQIVDL